LLAYASDDAAPAATTVKVSAGLPAEITDMPKTPVIAGSEMPKPFRVPGAYIFRLSNENMADKQIPEDLVR
jgi:hypothetical protein